MANESDWKEISLGIVHLYPLGYAYVKQDGTIKGNYQTYEEVRKEYREYIRTLDSSGKEVNSERGNA